ncbi:MAG: roadblock/LC7 domain-containing protein [Polyangiaceae bacterium]
MASKVEKVTEILRSIRTSSPEVIGAVVVSRDGFIVASVIPNEIDEDLIGGMASTLLGVGERIATDLMRAEMEQIFVKSPKGYIVVNAAGPESALVLLVTRDAKLGMVFIELKRIVAELVRQLA